MSFTLIQLDSKLIVRKLLIAAGNHLGQIADEPIEKPLHYIGWEALDEKVPIDGRWSKVPRYCPRDNVDRVGRATENLEFDTCGPVGPPGYKTKRLR
jgi:hypothetical protein